MIRKLTRSQCKSVNGQIQRYGVYHVDAHPTALVFLERMGYVVRDSTDLAMFVHGGIILLGDQLRKAGCK